MQPRLKMPTANTMVESAAKAKAHCCQTTISFLQKPPFRVLRGNAFTVIVQVSFPDHEKAHSNKLVALHSSLRHLTSAISVNGLRGYLTTSLQCPSDEKGPHVAIFKDIAIHQLGRFRLRILLAVSASSQTIIEACLDSEIIEVDSCQYVH